MSETATGKFLCEGAQIVRTLPEIKRAYDVLTLALLAAPDLSAKLGVPGLTLTEAQYADVAAYASVICWLLGISYNPVFGANLESLEQMLRDRFMVRAEDGSWHVTPKHVN